MMDKSSFDIVRDAYRSLSPEVKDKFRGRFTSIIDELEVYEELRNRGFEVSFKSGQGSYDLLVNKKKKIEVKSCNINNKWVREGLATVGCSNIKPTKFHILIYVEFDDSLNSFKHYVFTSNETLRFPPTEKERLWIARNKGTENRTIHNPFSTTYMNITQEEADSLNELMQKSMKEEAWDKIRVN